MSGAGTGRSGPEFNRSKAVSGFQKKGWSGTEHGVGAAEREWSSEQRSQKSGLPRSGKTFAHMLCSQVVARMLPTIGKTL